MFEVGRNPKFCVCWTQAIGDSKAISDALSKLAGGHQLETTGALLPRELAVTPEITGLGLNLTRTHFSFLFSRPAFISSQ